MYINSIASIIRNYFFPFTCLECWALNGFLLICARYINFIRKQDEARTSLLRNTNMRHIFFIIIIFVSLDWDFFVGRSWTTNNTVHGKLARESYEGETFSRSEWTKKISRYAAERIDDCLRRVIRRHQTSRSSSGIVYLALAPAGGTRPVWVGSAPPSLSQQ